MAQEQSQTARQEPIRVNRVFEQPPDAVSFYSDFAQVMGTGHEVLLQFYETILGVPGPKGAPPDVVRSRLRATVVLSRAHAANLGRLLLKQSEAEPPPPEAEPVPEGKR